MVIKTKIRTYNDLFVPILKTKFSGARKLHSLTSILRAVPEWPLSVYTRLLVTLKDSFQGTHMAAPAQNLGSAPSTHNTANNYL